jgi:2-C-methyl-D-erythritol 2,4-cyclodiphosphate synthase
VQGYLSPIWLPVVVFSDLSSQFAAAISSLVSSPNHHFFSHFRFYQHIKQTMFPFRIGQGYDVHQLEAGRPFWLGGLLIPHTHGARGHSDADVVCHVLCDALLGAANMRNIGYHFSDKDPQWKGVDSKLLLARVLEMVREKGFEVGNVDVTVVLQLPKLNPHIPAMKTCLAGVMGIDEELISIKATTSEHLGFVGREEGIAAHCVALIYRQA